MLTAFPSYLPDEDIENDSLPFRDCLLPLLSQGNVFPRATQCAVSPHGPALCHLEEPLLPGISLLPRLGEDSLSPSEPLALGVGVCASGCVRALHPLCSWPRLNPSGREEMVMGLFSLFRLVVIFPKEAKKAEVGAW